jgi:hypothetical protein
VRRDLTDDEQDAYAEHFYGYGPLPGIGARDPEPTDDEADSLLCDWCGEVVPDGASDSPPFCSTACEQDASQDRETYGSVHPRPEEVG